MIIAESLSKSFRKKGGKKNERVKAVRDVSFTADNGKITGLLGPNGAGKSTTLRMLATLMHPDSGKASIDGIDVVKQSPQAREKIGSVSYTHLTLPTICSV